MTRDKWAEWLANRRFGGDAALRERFVVQLAAIRDQVLDLAAFAGGEAVLDVGCGEGLIGFGAFDRGATAVTFSDISADVLDVCREAAEQLGRSARSRFVCAPATNLRSISDESVDVVTLRSVLIYVDDKAHAFEEFWRVLKPGGRLAMFEPINRFGREPGWWGPYDLRGLGELGSRLVGLYERLQPAETDPMLNFDERDLVRFAEATGFFPVRMQLTATIRAAEPQGWDAFLKSSGNPNIPTPAEAMAEIFTPEEHDRVVEYLKPRVEAGLGTARFAAALLSAQKP